MQFNLHRGKGLGEEGGLEVEGKRERKRVWTGESRRGARELPTTRRDALHNEVTKRFVAGEPAVPWPCETARDTATLIENTSNVVSLPVTAEVRHDSIFPAYETYERLPLRAYFLSHSLSFEMHFVEFFSFFFFGLRYFQKKMGILLLDNNE